MPTAPLSFAAVCIAAITFAPVCFGQTVATQPDLPATAPESTNTAPANSANVASLDASNIVPLDATPFDVVSESPASRINSPLVWSIIGIAIGAAVATLGLLVALRRAAAESRALAKERDAAIHEVREAVSSRRTLRYQSRMLAALLPDKPSEQSLQEFLKTILPRAASGFAAIVDRSSTPPAVVYARGTTLPDIALQTLPEKVDSRWSFSRGTSDDFLIPLDTRYALITSQLAPDDIEEPAARKILQSCLAAVAHQARTHHGRVTENDELRMTREMLALHEIAGKISDEPDTVLSEYLETLLGYQSFDRAALFLASDEAGTTVFNRIGQTGRPLHPGVEQATSDHEVRLAIATHDVEQYFCASELEEVGIGSLVGTAMTVQLMRAGRVCGVLCLTAAKPVARDASESRLLSWASRHVVVLLETLRDRVSMERRATRDGLTGLFNRAELDRRIDLGVSTATEQRGCTIILFDLDRFKRVNDTYGHVAGDEAIRHVAKIMQAVAIQCRSEDEVTVARYGGEELCILMPKAGLAAGLRIADQVRRDVATTAFQHDGRTIPLTISGGVATAPRHGQNAAALIEAADASLYTSKQLGRNRVTDATSIQSLDALKNSIQHRADER